MTISVLNTKWKTGSMVLCNNEEHPSQQNVGKKQKIEDKSMNAYKHNFALHLERTSQSELSIDSSSVNIIIRNNAELW